MTSLTIPQDWQRNVPLAPQTTLQLGGTAHYFKRCCTVDEVVKNVQFAKSAKIPWHILGGGSNTIVPDAGYPGLILAMGIDDIRTEVDGDSVLLDVGAGMDWDTFVADCVAEGLGGIEALSGIPGQVGATPIQNVGAYGQDVQSSIVDVLTYDTRDERMATLTNADCEFAYRHSRFKGRDKGRYIILAVRYRLRRHYEPRASYPELQRQLANHPDFASLPPGARKLEIVRETVLALRRRKAMVIDPDEPNSRSAGSFFTNPVVNAEQFSRLQGKHDGEVPHFPDANGIKIPAAWLVEHAGFSKGQRLGGVGISERHALALVNRGGTCEELMALAAAIQDAVKSCFGIELVREPVVVGN